MTKFHVELYQTLKVLVSTYLHKTTEMGIMVSYFLSSEHSPQGQHVTSLENSFPLMYVEGLPSNFQASDYTWIHRINNNQDPTIMNRSLRELIA